jgi:hypothetical protein
MLPEKNNNKRNVLLLLFKLQQFDRLLLTLHYPRFEKKLKRMFNLRFKFQHAKNPPSTGRVVP